MTTRSTRASVTSSLSGLGLAACLGLPGDESVGQGFKFSVITPSRWHSVYPLLSLRFSSSVFEKKLDLILRPAQQSNCLRSETTESAYTHPVDLTCPPRISPAFTSNSHSHSHQTAGHQFSPFCRLSFPSLTTQYRRPPTPPSIHQSPAGSDEESISITASLNVQSILPP